MLRTLIGRLSASILSLVILVTLTFVLAHEVPGGPAYSILGLKATPASIEAVNLQLGLDVPIWKQYLAWWGHLLQGDLGYSYLLNRPVVELMAEYERNTLALYLTGVSLATLLAIGTGLIHGVWYRGWQGRTVGALEIAFYALPSFFIGTLLILVFATALRWLPASGVADLRLVDPTLGDRLRHLVLPVATVTLFTFAALSRYFAQSVHEELGRDYVRTAASKGVGFSRIVFGHVLRNALRPLVTMLGLSFPFLFAGSVVVETVFSYPGLGWLLWRSALSHDYPVIIAIVLLIGVFTVLGNLLADLLNGVLDPRVRYA
jgi:peptide/nickel transport system permease protein